MSGTFGIIGGTGKQGSALANRLLQHNYEVRIGSRSALRGKEFAEKIGENRCSGGDNEYALNSDIIVLAIPFDQVEVLLTPYILLLEGKIVIDMTVNLQFGRYITAKLHNGQSSYEFLREFLPESDIVSCLKTISFNLLDGTQPLNQTDFQMTTSDRAYSMSSELVKLFGLTPVRVRGKTHAHTIERMVALSIQLNKEYPGSHVGFSLTQLKTTQ